MGQTKTAHRSTAASDEGRNQTTPVFHARAALGKWPWAASPAPHHRIEVSPRRPTRCRCLDNLVQPPARISARVTLEIRAQPGTGNIVAEATAQARAKGPGIIRAPSSGSLT